MQRQKRLSVINKKFRGGNHDEGKSSGPDAYFFGCLLNMELAKMSSKARKFVDFLEAAGQRLLAACCPSAPPVTEIPLSVFLYLYLADVLVELTTLAKRYSSAD